MKESPTPKKQRKRTAKCPHCKRNIAGWIESKEVWAFMLRGILYDPKSEELKGHCRYCKEPVVFHRGVMKEYGLTGPSPKP